MLGSISKDIAEGTCSVVDTNLGRMYSYDKENWWINPVDAYKVINDPTSIVLTMSYKLKDVTDD